MKKLIINADDFGFNRQITDGIIECHREGVLTSTTLMVNMPAADHAVEKAKHLPNLSVGIHLNLTLGRPLSPPAEIPSIVDQNGNFLNAREVFYRACLFKLNSKDVEKEFSAQIEKFLACGIEPSHCDSHHHVAACPQIFPIKIRLLQRYKIKRLRTHRGWYHRDINLRGTKALLTTLLTNVKKFPNRSYYEAQHLCCKLKGFLQPDERYGFSKLLSDKRLTYNTEGFRTLMENCPPGVIEFVVHPGHLSEDPMDRPLFRQQRFREYSTLMAPQCFDICRENGIQLINYKQF